MSLWVPNDPGPEPRLVDLISAASHRHVQQVPGHPRHVCGHPVEPGRPDGGEPWLSLLHALPRVMAVLPLLQGRHQLVVQIDWLMCVKNSASLHQTVVFGRLFYWQPVRKFLKVPNLDTFSHFIHNPCCFVNNDLNLIHKVILCPSTHLFWDSFSKENAICNS